MSGGRSLFQFHHSLTHAERSRPIAYFNIHVCILLSEGIRSAPVTPSERREEEKKRTQLLAKPESPPTQTPFTGVTIKRNERLTVI